MFNLNSNISWDKFNEKTPWIKLTSMGHLKSADKSIHITNKSLTYNNKGRPTTSDKSIIENCNITSEGSVGNTSKADISLKCFCKEDFEAIDKDILKLGSVIIIQYGWAPFSSPEDNINIKEYDIEQTYSKKGNFWRGIFIGRVTNFSYNLISSEIYDIKIESIRLGSDQWYLETGMSNNLNQFQDMGFSFASLIDGVLDWWNKTSQDVKWYIKGGNSNRKNYMTWNDAIDYISYKTNLNLSNPINASMINNFKKRVYVKYNSKLISVDPTIMIIRDSTEIFNKSDSMLINDYIWICVQGLFQILDSSTDFKGTVNTLISKINSASAGLWELNLITDERAGSLKIVDINNDKIDDVQEIIKLYDKNNFIIKNVSMQSNIPSSDNLSIFHSGKGGSNTTCVHISNLFGNVKDYFNNPSTDADDGLWYEAYADYETLQATIKKNTRQVEFDYKNKLNTIAKDDYYVGHTLKRYMLDILNDGKDKVGVWGNRLIPINLSIDIEGNCDARWGDKFYISDLLPSRYTSEKSQIYFFITSINHSISSNDWSTTIETVSKLNYSKVKVDKSNIDRKINIAKIKSSRRTVRQVIQDIVYEVSTFIWNGKLVDGRRLFGVGADRDDEKFNSIYKHDYLSFLDEWSSMLEDPKIISQSQTLRKLKNQAPRPHWGVDISSQGHKNKNIYAPCDGFTLAAKGTFPSIGGYMILYKKIDLTRHMVVRILHAYTEHSVNRIYKKGEYIGSYNTHPSHNNHNYAIHTHVEPVIVSGNTWNPSNLNRLNGGAILSSMLDIKTGKVIKQPPYIGYPGNKNNTSVEKFITTNAIIHRWFENRKHNA